MSITFYNENAQVFYTSTHQINMTVLSTPFLDLIPDGGMILDAGCGSGRDSRAFQDQGYQVVAFDASQELALLARERLEISVHVSTFQRFHSELMFDGIWACASLLHVPEIQINQTFKHLSRYLKLEGIFYCSFKYGRGEECRGDRTFTHADEERLLDFIDGAGLKLINTWVAQDLRPHRQDELWLNALCRRVELNE